MIRSKISSADFGAEEDIAMQQGNTPSDGKVYWLITVDK